MNKDHYSLKDIFNQTGHLSDEVIGHYVQGSLDEEATRQVESHIIDCEFCDNAVEAYMELGQPAMDEMAARLDQRFERMMEQQQDSSNVAEAKTIEFNPQPGNTGSPFRKYYSIAAGILLIAVVGVIFLQMNGGNTSALEQVNQPVYTILRGGDATSMDDAGILFNGARFDEAAEAFAKFEGVKADYYEAVSLLFAGKYAEAIPVFQSVIEKNGKFAEEAEWYLANTYVRQKDYQNATALYQDIKDKPEGDFSEQAAQKLELLKKLN